MDLEQRIERLMEVLKQQKPDDHGNISITMEVRDDILEIVGRYSDLLN